MVNIANNQGSEEVLRDWLMNGKFESRSGFELDLDKAQAAAQWSWQAVDKQLVPVKVTDAGGEKGFFSFQEGEVLKSTRWKHLRG